MRKSILFIAIFLSAGICSITSAQNEFCDSCKQLSVSICPTEMVSGYEMLYVEYKFSKHFSLELGGGHISPLLYPLIGADQPSWLAYKGTVVRISGKYYRRNNAYHGLTLTLKEASYSWQEFSYLCQGSYPQVDDYWRSERSTVLGASYIFGYKRSVGKCIEIEYYFGLGLAWRDRHYSLYSTWPGTEGCYSDHFSPVLGKHAKYIAPGDFHASHLSPCLPIGIKIKLTLNAKN